MQTWLLRTIKVSKAIFKKLILGLKRPVSLITDLYLSNLTENEGKVRVFFEKWASKEKDYYLIVGRFVPENNYETIIQEFMKSKTRRDLLIICNHEGNPYLKSSSRKQALTVILALSLSVRSMIRICSNNP